MKNLRKSIASLLTTSVLVSGSALAELGAVDENGALTNVKIDESDIITLSFNHPQSLAISAPNNVTERSSGGIISRKWQVVSNNAVTIKMTGKSKTDAGGDLATPVFYKQEVNSSGNVIADRYDTLITTYGATVAGHNDLSGTAATWGGGAAADTTGTVTDGQDPGTAATKDYASVLSGTPANLVGASLTDNFGTIMPADNGRFTLSLSAKGIGDVATTQSGDYQVTIVASFMANEQGNGLVVASTVATADPATLLSAVDTYTATELGTDADDNTNWNNTTDGSTAVDGTTDQNPDDIQTDDGLSASNATYY
jgi:hypothetical protein